MRAMACSTANGWYNNSQKASRRRTNSFYYPGGDFGGPVIIPGTHFNKNHDKLFFYAAYEYMDQHPAGALQQYFVPTPQMLAGELHPGLSCSSLGPIFVNCGMSCDSAPNLNSATFTPAARSRHPTSIRIRRRC